MTAIDQISTNNEMIKEDIRYMRRSMTQFNDDSDEEEVHVSEEISLVRTVMRNHVRVLRYILSKI